MGEPSVLNSGKESDKTRILCNDMMFSKGYLLPKDNEVLHTPWMCTNCGEEKGISNIEHVLLSLKEVVNQIKSQILSVIKNNPSELVRYITSSVELLQEHLHPNHFLVFNYKIWILELSLGNNTSRNTKEEDEFLGEDNQNDHIRNQIYLLDLQMKYHYDILSIVEVLVPGPTEANAEH